jgi:L-asparaginase
MAYALLQKIVLLGTGGTIAGTAGDPDDNLGYTAAQVSVAQLLHATPELSTLARSLQTEQIAQVDSKDMSFAVWQRLALRCAHWLAQDDVRGAVITHGTDTLEETAYFLHAVLPPALLARKPVVLTCAMRPASSRCADGPQNLQDALALAQDPHANGVLAVCAGRIHSALQVQKVHPYRLDAFDSGEAGAQGVMEEGRVRWLNTAVHQMGDADAAAVRTGAGGTLLERLAGAEGLPRVEIITSHAGASACMVDALLAYEAATQDRLRGLVVAATGNGSLHQELERALLRAQASGVAVVRATRCAYGRVLPRPGDPIPDSCGLSPVKARIALQLQLLGT